MLPKRSIVFAEWALHMFLCLRFVLVRMCCILCLYKLCLSLSNLLENGLWNIFLPDFSENKNIDCETFLYEMLIALTYSLESIEKKLAWKAQTPIYYFQNKKGHWYAETSLELSSQENP